MTTHVYLASTNPPVSRTQCKVKYDAWGTPYVEPDSMRMASTIVLRGNGETDDWVYGVKWKHKSGPQVTFGERPKRLFGYTDEIKEAHPIKFSPSTWTGRK